MGLFSKHKGRTARSFAFMVHVHTLTTSANRGRLVVALERHGKRAAATAPTAGASTRGAAAGAVYLFEEALALPATLYEVGAARAAVVQSLKPGGLPAALACLRWVGLRSCRPLALAQPRCCPCPRPCAGRARAPRRQRPRLRPQGGAGAGAARGPREQGRVGGAGLPHPRPVRGGCCGRGPRAAAQPRAPRRRAAGAVGWLPRQRRRRRALAVEPGFLGGGGGRGAGGQRRRGAAHAAQHRRRGCGAGGAGLLRAWAALQLLCGCNVEAAGSAARPACTPSFPSCRRQPTHKPQREPARQPRCRRRCGAGGCT